MFANAYRRIFVLGSGFSKSFSHRMPVLKDLTDAFFSDTSQAPGSLRTYAARYYELSNHDPQVHDFESLGTLLFTKSIFQDFNEELAFLRYRTEYMKFVHDAIVGFGPDKAALPILQAFLNRCAYTPGAMSNFRDSLIITFNYDLLLEDTLGRLSLNTASNPSGPAGVDYSVEFNRYSGERPARLDSMSCVDVLKLHGSFNWFRAKGSTRNDISQIYRVEPGEPEAQLHRGDPPCFIPMSHAKQAFLEGTLFNTLWARAAMLLGEAEEIHLIGYGFPKTDLSNLLFFLDYKERIRRITVREPEGSPGLQRLRSIFGSDVVLNADAKEYVARELLG